MADLVLGAFRLALLVFGGLPAVGAALLALVLAVVAGGALCSVWEWGSQWFRR